MAKPASPLRVASWNRRGLCATILGLIALAGCTSERARPEGATTSTTTLDSVEATTTTVASTRPAPTTTPLLSSPVTAALGGRPATFRRVDLPLALSAPASLVATSPGGVVAIGWRGVGCCAQSASAVFSADGRQWRTVATPWDDRPSSSTAPRSFGEPRALAYGDGTFLSVGLRVDVAEDGSRQNSAIAASSADGSSWESIDLPSAPDTLYPTQVVRSGSRWIVAADRLEGGSQRQTLLLASSDGRDWEGIASLDFAVQQLRTTSYGILAVGSRAESNATQWLTAVSSDGATWNTSVLNLGPTTPVQSVLVDADQAVLVISEDVSGFSKDRRARLVSSRDGLTWQTSPAPPCFVAGDYIGPTAAVSGAWAIVVDSDTPKLALSFDHGATWSCTELSGATFETDPRWGPPFLTSIADVQGKLALVGGRTIEPGVKGNWAAALWYVS